MGVLSNTWQTLRHGWLRRRAPSEGPMRTYLDTPLPGVGHDYREADFLALDLETSGLNPARDEIISIGYVPLRRGRVRLREARHRLVRIRGGVAQSAALHGLTDDRLAEGRALGAVLAEVLEALAGRVLLVHHAPLDVGFLHAACGHHYGVGLSARVVDTLALAARRARRRQDDLPEGALRLHALRRRYGLPRYPAHDALTDALATAELFLALSADMARGQPLPLRGLLS